MTQVWVTSTGRSFKDLGRVQSDLFVEKHRLPAFLAIPSEKISTKNMSDKARPRQSPKKSVKDIVGKKGDTESAGNGEHGVNGDSPNGRMNLWPKSGVSRSFVQKRMTKEPLGSRFPDSERGESRARASFLMDASMLEASTESKYQELERMNQSPTSAQKRFSKTIPATLDADDHTTNEKAASIPPSAGVREDNKPSPSHNESDNDSPGKKGRLFKGIFMSKHRNKK